MGLADGARVVAVRSGLVAAGLSGRGGMASVALPSGEVAERLGGWAGRLSVAAVNGPSSTVVSGDPQALDEFLAGCETQGVRVRRIAVDYASHSAQVDDVVDELMVALADITPRVPEIPFFSTVTGGPVEETVLDAGYWVRNLREPVLFEPVVRGLLDSGRRVFVEVSPHPVLTVGMQETIDAAADSSAATDSASDAVAFGTLRRDDGGPGRFLASVAEVFTRGVAVDWAPMFGAPMLGAPPRRVDLPTYAFQEQRYWLEPAGPGATDVAAAGLDAADHPLLGAAVTVASSDSLLVTGRLSLSDHPWLADHAVSGTVLLPGAAFVELAVHVGSQVGCGRVEDLTIAVPLVLPASGAVRIQVTVDPPDDGGRRAVSFFSHPDTAGADAGDRVWTRHASGLLAADTRAPSIDTGAWPPAGAEPAAHETLYDDLAAVGFTYGPVFRGLRAAWRLGDEVLAEVSLPSEHGPDAGSFGLHPALLDAALHAMALGGLPNPGERDDSTRLPFAWSGIGLYATGATALRVRLAPAGRDAISLRLTDTDGQPVATIESLVLRAVDPARPAGGSVVVDDLYEFGWVTVPPVAVDVPVAAGSAPSTWAVLGADPVITPELTELTELAGSGVVVDHHVDLPALSAAVAAGVPVPAVVLVPCPSAHPDPGTGPAEDGRVGGAPAQQAPAQQAPAQQAWVEQLRAEDVRTATGHALRLAQQWLADDRFASSRLVLVSRAAVAAGPGDPPADPVSAAVWGLLLSARSENPDRFALIDLDAEPASWQALPTAVAALAADEPRLAIRAGEVRVGRLVRAGGGDTLVPPAVAAWRLESTGKGALANLALLPCPEASGPLVGAQVRVRMRASGLNFRDALNALGLYPGDAGPLGIEGAGVVVEVGPDVTDLAVGEAVMGLFAGSFASLTVTDRRMLARVPAGWTFGQAASVPVVFLTAYYGLVDLAGLHAGQTVLVHAAAGGVGMAAVQLARHLGAEVYATASPGKWDVLRAMGIDDDHLASSRTLDFADRFHATSGGAGVDVVLNALAGEFVDASLRLLPRGGAFVEMGKTDVRDAAVVAAERPGVRYHAFELMDAGLGRLQELFAEVIALFAQGVLNPLPTRFVDVRRAPEAFRFLSQGRHIGKIVLTAPPATPATGWDPQGTVLVTGATGTLGALVARHLVAVHGVRHLVLVGRRGAAAPGAARLAQELDGLGATVTLAACDAADRDQLAAVVDAIPARHPLTAVVHAAGVLDDGVVAALTPERLDQVLRPKVDAVLNLHALTAGRDLAAFVLFSSIAGIFGGPGQGNYAAANAFLDAFAERRRAAGLPAVSMVWGRWAPGSDMTGHLDDTALRRMDTGGLRPLDAEAGLALFDAAAGASTAVSVPAAFDLAAIRALASTRGIPASLRGLVRP
ncbi:SDR family NAD(P)-dependent oxidoreductase, partial [Frankia sp. AgKG'84/4]